MVAWLVEVGLGRRSAAETADVMARKDTQALRCNMAPAWGLYLAEVHYEAEALSAPNRNIRSAPVEDVLPAQVPTT
jgi:tRNA U38,U39,U40 pseudouridine synthase TruA